MFMSGGKWFGDGVSKESDFASARGECSSQTELRREAEASREECNAMCAR